MESHKARTGRCPVISRDEFDVTVLRIYVANGRSLFWSKRTVCPAPRSSPEVFKKSQ